MGPCGAPGALGGVVVVVGLAPSMVPGGLAQEHVHPSREIVHTQIGREIDYFFYAWLEKE